MIVKKRFGGFFKDKKGNVFDFINEHVIAVMVLVTMAIAFGLLYAYGDDLLDFFDKLINFRN